MTRSIRLALALTTLSCALLAPLAFGAPLGTAFTYQGKLAKDAAPYAGTADFVFRLYDDPAAGNQVGADVSLAGITVTDGLFTVDLDFGAVFNGEAMWLEISVQTPGDADYTALAPRQSLAATPYALHALSAPGGGGTSQWNDNPNGIDYPNNVGIGGQPGPGIKLFVDGGTANLNPLYVANNNVNYAALAVHNFASGGYGLYDLSTRNYVAGKLGIGNLNPTYPLEVNSTLGGGVRITSSGYVFDNTRAALYVHGMNGGGIFGAPSGGIYASSVDDRGISGWSTNYWGVSGDCTSAGTYGVLGSPGEGVYGSSPNVAKPGGRFVCPPGGISVDGSAGLVKAKTLQILGADLAESFPVADAAEPGTVLMLTGDADGRLCVADEAYSPRVAGVVSGANGLDAAVVLKGASFEGDGHAPVALSGRVWVKCDASRAAIRVGDLLTTSDVPGHAMRASDRERAHGAVLGKAMTALEEGMGMVLVLVNLQ